MPEIQIITTADGSHSLLNADLQETYHSSYGAIQESKHVFIRSGLDYWVEHNPRKKIRILEMGFGAGLNAFLTLLATTHSDTPVYYESWEMYPVVQSVIAQLNYGDILNSSQKFISLHEALWEKQVAITPNFVLSKHNGDIQSAPFEESSFDIIYYDAFAPSKQPELWVEEMLKKVTNTLAPGGVWVTYCAKGQVKRDLRSLGLTVEILQGAPGKKEMIRALR